MTAISKRCMASVLVAVSCHAAAAPRPTVADCTGIVSDIERLGCFDAAAGTPPSKPAPPAAASAGPAAPARPPAPLDPGTLIRLNEAARQDQRRAFLLSRSDDREPGQTRVVISAPALDAAERPVYLAISCISNISRLQLLLAAPAARNQMRVRLFIDDTPLGGERTWQVVGEGDLVDAGRGLVAIDLLRRFTSGGRLRVQSDHAPLNGLMFNAEGLRELVAQQREACHW